MDELTISEVHKNDAILMFKKYHYLGDKEFIHSISYGLYLNHELIGVANFGSPSGISTMKGWFGRSNDDAVCKMIYELNRLVIVPQYNGKNFGSYFLSRCLKLLKKKGIKGVISLADASHHSGYIYQACNFIYYGLTDKKPDFYKYESDNHFKLNPRGKTTYLHGVWLNRSQKHRYYYPLDKKIDVLYEKSPYPKDATNAVSCCNGTYQVVDNRHGMLYTCPLCTGKLRLIDKIKESKNAITSEICFDSLF